MGTGRAAAAGGWLRGFFLLEAGPGRNPALDGFRGAAALLVLFAHVISSYAFNYRGVLFMFYEARPPHALVGTLSRTDLALFCLHKMHPLVDLFFLLSGLLTMLTFGRRSAAPSYGSFLGRRLLRIYPAFLASLAIAIAVRVCWLRALPFDLPTLAMNLLFLNGCPVVDFWVRPYNYPTWSLFPECLFYLLFPLLHGLMCRARRADPAQRIGPTIGLLGTVLLTTAVMPRLSAFYYGIVLGMADDASLRALADRLPTRRVLAIFGAAWLYYVLAPVHWPTFSPLFGVAAGLFLLKACYGAGRLSSAFASPVLRWFGSISYSFYLVHTLGIDITDVVLGRLLRRAPIMVALPVYLGASMVPAVVMAVLVFAVCERWYYRKRRPAAHDTASGEPEALPAGRRAA